MNEQTRTNYFYTINKLLKADNPERMLKEMIQGGYNYITEDFKSIIDLVISEDKNLIAKLKYSISISDESLSHEDVGITGIEKKILKAESIKELLEKMSIHNTKARGSDGSNKNSNKNQNNLTINKIALKCYYLKQHITLDNADEIIRKYGMTSGKKLYQAYNSYFSRADRRAAPYPLSRTKFINKIKLFECVRDLLPKEKCKSIEEDIEALRSNYKEEFS